MVLAMCRPVKHPTTGVYLFRKRVPKNLRSLVGKLEVKRSLGTKDPKEAKRLCPEMAEAVEREWALLQAAPTALSHKEIDQTKPFGQGGSTFEEEAGSALFQAIEQGIQRPADPEVLLDILRRRAEA